MNSKNFLCTLSILSAFTILSCYSPTKEQLIIEKIGATEYSQLMTLSLDDFDQSEKGFRQYSNDYELVSLLIPEYIEVNQLVPRQSRNLHWHLGQIHAFNDNAQAAILEMQQSYIGDHPTWDSYVKGSIAFLKKDKPKLLEALETLRQQDNQMNLEFLEKFVKHFDKSYAEAYSMEN